MKPSPLRHKPMQRSSIKRKPSERREAKQIGEGYKGGPRAVAVAVAGPARATVVVPKTPGGKDQRIRDSASGEECSIRIVGACNGRTDTTVWCHLPGIDGGRGMGFKAVDLCGAYGCFDCHNVVDGRAPLPAGATRTSVMLDFHAGHMRSLVILKQKGLA